MKYSEDNYCETFQLSYPKHTRRDILETQRPLFLSWKLQKTEGVPFNVINFFRKNTKASKRGISLISLTFFENWKKLASLVFEPTQTHTCFTATHSSTMQLEQLIYRNAYRICQFAGLSQIVPLL